MNKFSRFFFGFLSILFFSFSVLAQEGTAQPKVKQKTFAVLELFTSEGCSSCIDADELLSKLEKNAEKEGSEIYFLNYHVSYWDNLGWKDELASKKFDEHQEFYKNYLPIPKSYTPQMIVNGSQEFIGSDEALIKRAIEDSYKNNKPNYFVKLAAIKQDSTKLEVECVLSNLPVNSQLQIALVEKNILPVKVNAGENKGKKILHYSAVRLLETIENPEENNKLALNFKLPKGASKYTVIAYIQDKDAREILSVEQTKVRLQ